MALMRPLLKYHPTQVHKGLDEGCEHERIKRFDKVDVFCDNHRTSPLLGSFFTYYSMTARLWAVYNGGVAWNGERYMPEKIKRAPLAVRRLDVVVAVVAAALLIALVVLSEATNPKRLGATIAYLSPAYGGIQDVWLAPLSDPENPIQLTRTQWGVYDFGVSRDGKYIAYAERQESGLHEIFLINLQTRQVTPITNCEVDGADCRSAQFRPSGDAIAYERVVMSTRLGMGESTLQLGTGAIRIWLLDLATRTTRPLADDPQFVGHSPRWSLDGGSIAFFSSDIMNPGVMVYNFAPSEGEKSLKFVPSQYGAVGALSPNGTQMIYPDLTRRSDGQIYTYLRIADLEGLQFVNLTAPEEPIDDTTVEWHPNGESIVFERRYTDDRYTRGHQIYQMDMATKEVKPLIVDDNYNHGFFALNQTGTKLVLQRFPFFSMADGSNPMPEIWIYDMETGDLTLMSGNAFHPRWVVGQEDA